MEKQGGAQSMFGRKTWKSRYVVMTASLVSYYNDAEEWKKGYSPLKAGFSLDGCTVEATSGLVEGFYNVSNISS